MVCHKHQDDGTVRGSVRVGCAQQANRLTRADLVRLGALEDLDGDPGLQLRPGPGEGFSGAAGFSPSELGGREGLPFAVTTYTASGPRNASAARVSTSGAGQRLQTRSKARGLARVIMVCMTGTGIAGFFAASPAVPGVLSRSSEIRKLAGKAGFCRAAS